MDTDARMIAIPSPQRDTLTRLTGSDTEQDEWRSAFALYEVALRARGIAPGTIRQHRHCVALLARRYRSPLDVTLLDLQAWLANRSWSLSTLKSARSAATSFFGWSADVGVLTASPAAHLAPVRVARGVPRPISDKIFFGALAAWPDPRVALMLLLARYAGLKCDEIASLRYEQSTEGMLYVTGTGGDTRVVPIVMPRSAASLERGGSDNGFIFQSHSSRGGECLTPEAVSTMISDAPPRRWTSHKLRHACIATLYAATRDALALGKVLGHAKPETMLRYVEADQESLRRVSEGATRGHLPPRGRLPCAPSHRIGPLRPSCWPPRSADEGLRR